MAVEIERKFLVAGNAWRAQISTSTLLRQGYLANTLRASIRVRLAGGQGWLSVKAMTPGRSRAEYESAIAAVDANEMLDRLCEGPLIEKWRHIVPHDGNDWEVDEFLGENAGLVIAELELQSERGGLRAASSGLAAKSPRTSGTSTSGCRNSRIAIGRRT